MTRTSGTKKPLIRSASRCSGALDPWARRTSSTMRASAVSRPTRVARMTNVPVVLSVAPITSSPGPRSTGMGSPVSIDWSTAEPPSTTIPSTGTFSPGRTRSMSPTAICSSGTSSSTEPRTRRAVDGWRPISRRIAPVVRPRARASSQRPSNTRPMISADVSKYASGWSPASWMTSGWSVTNTLYAHAAVVPTTTSVLMLVPKPCRRARHAAP
jgi:hypothetical protein